MNGSPVVALVRGWVDLYTRGLPADARVARRDEIDDDLWCEHAEAATTGRSARSLDAGLAMRLVLGIPSDISWRLAHQRAPDPAILERSTATSTRILGVLAIAAASSMGFLLILSGAMGDALWAWGGTMILLAGSMIAFMAAALGLAWRFQERIGPLGVFGAILVMMGSTMILSAYAPGLVVLPVGSAMLMWDLAYIGVLSRRASIAHLAAAVILLIGLAVALLSQTSFAVGLVGMVSYLLSWIAIGLSLRRGMPQAEARSG